jgi:hypothetical protein
MPDSSASGVTTPSGRPVATLNSTTAAVAKVLPACAVIVANTTVPSELISG